MVKITFDIPDDKIQRVITAMVVLYPIPIIQDPKFVFDIDNPKIAEMVPEFTNSVWAKERIRRFIIDTVRRYETMIAKNSAINSISADDSIVV